jgi:hypothetical protein
MKKRAKAPRKQLLSGNLTNEFGFQFNNNKNNNNNNNIYFNTGEEENSNSFTTIAVGRVGVVCACR